MVNPQISLMTKAKTVSEMLELISAMTWLTARVDVTEFRLRKSFKQCTISFNGQDIHSSAYHLDNLHKQICELVGSPVFMLVFRDVVTVP
jgi:hypothetical protein